MTDDEVDKYICDLAEQAVKALPDPADASAVLFSAGAAVLVANYPCADVPGLIRSMSADMADGIDALLGGGRSIQ